MLKLLHFANSTYFPTPTFTTNYARTWKLFKSKIETIKILLNIRTNGNLFGQFLRIGDLLRFITSNMFKLHSKSSLKFPPKVITSRNLSLGHLGGRSLSEYLLPISRFPKSIQTIGRSVGHLRTRPDQTRCRRCRRIM